MTAFFFPDTTALINFEIIDRWDLLTAAVGADGQWCGSVASECADWDRTAYPGILSDAEAIFGTPVYPEPSELINTRVMRNNMADPTADWPKRHLGEAETITVVTARFQGSRFITDDAGAKVFAEAEGIKCYGTGDLLVVTEKHYGLITAKERAALEQALAYAGRTIRYFQFSK